MRPSPEIDAPRAFYQAQQTYLTTIVASTCALMRFASRARRPVTYGRRQARGADHNALSSTTGVDPQCRRKVRLARADRPKNGHVVAALNERVFGIRSVNPVEAVAPCLGSLPSRGGDEADNQARVGSVGAQG